LRLQQFCLQVLVVCVFRWSADFHRVARLSKSRPSKPFTPGLDSIQQNALKDRIESGTDWLKSHKAALK
jgi:hypothetical protein